MLWTFHAGVWFWRENITVACDFKSCTRFSFISLLLPRFYYSCNDVIIHYCRSSVIVVHGPGLWAISPSYCLVEYVNMWVYCYVPFKVNDYNEGEFNYLSQDMGMDTMPERFNLSRSKLHFCATNYLFFTSTGIPMS